MTDYLTAAESQRLAEIDGLLEKTQFLIEERAAILTRERQRRHRDKKRNGE